MDVTNLPHETSLLKQLIHDYPQYSFCETTDGFRWSPQENTVYFAPTAVESEEGIAQLLHELGHAKLNHQGYQLDIELLAMETAAWQQGQEIAKNYDVCIENDNIQMHLDSYRTWLHSRSTCPECQQTGLQNTKSTYQCLNCRCSWRVNDAKWCALRRYRLAT